MTDPDLSAPRKARGLPRADRSGVGAAAIAERVRRSPARAGTVRVVGVDGPSGSGKTTYAEQLAAELGCAVLHVDDLVPGWDGLAQAPPILVEQVLVPLADGRAGRFQHFDWVRGDRGEWQDVPTSAYLVIEGSGAGSRIVAEYVALLVWVEAPEAVRFARGIARDGETYRPHWERWAAQERELFAVERTRDRADVIVDGG